MSKSNIAGLTTGERLSKISESEILKLAHTPNYSNLDAPCPASSPLHTVPAACKNIPYTDEAASEARTKLFPCGIIWAHQQFFLLYLQVMNAALESNCM